jgi:subtilisin family serine protease
MSRSFRPSILPVTFLLAVAFAACGDAPFVAPEAPSDIAFDAVAANAAQAGPDDWIVVFKPGVADPPGLARRLVSEHGGHLRFTYEYAIQGFAATLPAQALNGIRDNPNVDYVEADGVVTIGESQNNPPSWGLDRIDQADLPLDASYTYNFDGSSVHAYIIDTGIRATHNEFGGRVGDAFDSVNDGQDGNDCHGHGTHVAGTVGGSAHGVAKNVDLVAVRVLGCGGSGSSSGVIAGIEWVTANHVAPAVANMSLGGGYWQAINDAVSGSVAAGVVYAVSAGNASTDACTRSPASTPEALTTGSTTSSDTRSSFSNYGTCVDLFAPGSSITSAWIGSNSATRTISGTSMASPHVAGVAALRREQCPGESATEVSDAILGAAAPGRVSNPGSGSPNLLLQSLLTASCGSGGGVVDPVDVGVRVGVVSKVRLSNRKHKAGEVDVTVYEDGTTTGIAGVMVEGDWFKNDDSTPSKSSSLATNGQGIATLSSGSVKGASSLRFCVTSLSGSGFIDKTNYSADPVCSSGDGGDGGGGDDPLEDLTATAKKQGKSRVNLRWTPWSAPTVDTARPR